jgi:hypothetical protein
MAHMHGLRASVTFRVEGFAGFVVKVSIERIFSAKRLGIQMVPVEVSLFDQ